MRTGPGRRDRLGRRSSSTVARCERFLGALTGPNPTDRGKNGSKRHVACDGQGTPLAIIHTGANVHDSEQAIPLIDAIPPIKRPGGGRRKRPEESLRRSRLRRRRKDSPAAAQARHSTLHRQAKHGAWQRLGQTSLRRRMGLRLAVQIPPAARSLRKTRRHSYRFLTIGCLLIKGLVKILSYFS